MISLENYEEFFILYVDNELTIETSLKIARHLETCSACRERIDILLRLKSQLRFSIRTTWVPPGLEAGVRAILQMTSKNRGEST